MKRFKDLKIATRLNIATNLLFVLILGPLAVYTIFLQKRQLSSDTDIRMYEQVNDLATITIDEVAQRVKYTENALKVCENIVLGSRNFIAANQYITLDAKNQETNDVTQVKLKRMVVNGEALFNNSEILDKVPELTGSEASILQKIPQGYVRIATTLIQNDGKRAIGTYIPNNSPVAKAMDNGETYVGRDMVLGQLYLTTYKPYKLEDGSIMVLFTGTAAKSLESLKAFFISKKYFSTGYPFLVDNMGNVLIHPQVEGSM
jgi:methyl-accepting chemotaxis protein